MIEWKDITKEKPESDFLYCWVMNCRKGAYGFIAIWHARIKTFEYQQGHSHLNPALDVTHWYPLPEPFWKDA